MQEPYPSASISYGLVGRLNAELVVGAACSWASGQAEGLQGPARFVSAHV